MKREVAAAHFNIGKAEEGEKLFKEYLEQHPTSGWGQCHKDKITKNNIS
jgi:hypothetical protein